MSNNFNSQLSNYMEDKESKNKVFSPLYDYVCKVKTMSDLDIDMNVVSKLLNYLYKNKNKINSKQNQIIDYIIGDLCYLSLKSNKTKCDFEDLFNEIDNINTNDQIDLELMTKNKLLELLNNLSKDMSFEQMILVSTKITKVKANAKYNYLIDSIKLFILQNMCNQCINKSLDYNIELLKRVLFYIRFSYSSYLNQIKNLIINVINSQLRKIDINDCNKCIDYIIEIDLFNTNNMLKINTDFLFEHVCKKYNQIDIKKIIELSNYCNNNPKYNKKILNLIEMYLKKYDFNKLDKKTLNQYIKDIQSNKFKNIIIARTNKFNNNEQFSKTNIITIDTQNTRIYDNGFSLEKYDDENYKLHIFIANAPYLYDEKAELWDILYNKIKTNKQMNAAVTSKIVTSQLSLNQKSSKEVIHLEFYLDKDCNAVFDKMSKEKVKICRNYYDNFVKEIVSDKQKDNNSDLLKQCNSLSLLTPYNFSQVVSLIVNNTVKTLGKKQIYIDGPFYTTKKTDRLTASAPLRRKVDMLNLIFFAAQNNLSLVSDDKLYFLEDNINTIVKCLNLSAKSKKINKL